MPAKKVDLFGRHQGDYSATRTPRVVTVKPGRYLAISGEGAQGGELFQKHVGSLYGMAYTLKFATKARGKDFKVPPLEGVWWGQGRIGEPGSDWSWKLLLRVPNFVKRRDLAPAAESLRGKGRADFAGQVKLEELAEGRCIQALHIGPYASEPETLERLRRVASDLGLAFRGRHHEIYLSDPRRVPPERLRTILRMPVRAAR
jgi:hypothetical protein